MWFRDGWRSTAPHAFAYLPSTVTISSCVQAITEGIYFRYTMQKCCVQHMPDIPKKIRMTCLVQIILLATTKVTFFR